MPITAKSKGRYVYYQPNDKDLKDKFGDCTIRALSKALDCTWLEAYDKMIPLCREEQVSNVFDCDIKTRKRMMEKLGFEYTGISVKSGKERPTVDKFASTHKKGRYILNVAHHEVACVDGKYYDTWNSGYKSLYGYFTLKGE